MGDGRGRPRRVRAAPVGRRRSELRPRASGAWQQALDERRQADAAQEPGGGGRSRNRPEPRPPRGRTGVPVPPRPCPRGGGPDVRTSAASGDVRGAARCRSSSLLVASCHGCRCAVRRPEGPAPDDGPDRSSWRSFPTGPRGPLVSPVRWPAPAPPLSRPRPRGPPPRFASWAYTDPVAADRGTRSSFPTGKENCGGRRVRCPEVGRNSHASHRPSTGYPHPVHRMCVGNAHRPV